MSTKAQTTENYLTERKRAYMNIKWRRQQSEMLPGLAARVFALRNTNYPGSGFHYAMEGTLGRIISGVMQYDSTMSVSDRICLEVGIELLIEGVEKAERSIAETIA